MLAIPPQIVLESLAALDLPQEILLTSLIVKEQFPHLHAQTDRHACTRQVRQPAFFRMNTKGAHLHYTQWKGSSGVRATFNGVDTAVHAGAKNADGNYPTENLVSANCPVPPFGPPVSAVSRAPNCLDVFTFGRDGRILAAAWEQQLLEGKWRGWWSIVLLGKRSTESQASFARWLARRQQA